jgi:TolB-like protein
MPDIFLSYTREDQTTAQRFAEAFEAQGFSVWWDATLRPGEAFDEVTEAALREAKAVVVLWSPRSVTSRWVRAEAAIADRNKTLMPVTIELCDRPVMFELTQTADLSRWTGEGADPAWRAFLADVRRFVEAEATPQSPAPRSASKARAMASTPSSRPSLAVLPFINRSELRADDVFAECMVEDLTAALSLSSWMDVLAASATATYRAGARDLREIGRDLGVRYLLEGHVRRLGDHLRVTAQLVEAESGRIIWTQKFDRPLAELSALQEDLGAEVAAHLDMQVMQAEMEHALKNPGNNSVWDRAMRGAAYISRATRSGYMAAVAETKRRVEADPDDAAAYAGMAASQAQLLHLTEVDDPALAREITENIRKARALDADNPRVLSSIASALAALGKPQEALPLIEHVIAKNRNLAQGRVSRGSILVRLGRSDDALAEFDATERLAPNSWLAYQSSIWRSVAHLKSGHRDEAIGAADRALRFLPGAEALIQSMLCLAMLNDWDHARDALRRLRDTDPEISQAIVEKVVRYFYWRSNAVDEYVATARRLWDEAACEDDAP